MPSRDTHRLLTVAHTLSLAADIQHVVISIDTSLLLLTLLKFSS